jgi:O-antigen ligase
MPASGTLIPRYISTYLVLACLFFWLAACTRPLIPLRHGRWVAIAVLAVYCILFLRGLGRPIPGRNRLLMQALIFLLLSGLVSAALSISPLLSFTKLTMFSAVVVPLMCFAIVKLRPDEAREWLRAVLCFLVVAAPAVALFPAELRPEYDDPTLFQGSAGDANTMGHIAALAFLALIFSRERAPARHPWRTWAFLLLMGMGFLLLATKARSSAFSVLVGLVVAVQYVPRLRNTLILLAFFGTTLLLVAGELESRLTQFIVKHDLSEGKLRSKWRRDEDSFVGRILATRIPPWKRAWEASLERPMFGWGFGVSATTPPDWKFSLSATGTLEEVNNDILQVLEGTGFVGLAAHLMVVLTILLRFRPPPNCRSPDWIIAYCLTWALWSNLMLDGSSHGIGYLTSGLFWLLLALTACPALHVPRRPALPPRRRINPRRIYEPERGAGETDRAGESEPD